VRARGGGGSVVGVFVFDFRAPPHPCAPPSPRSYRMDYMKFVEHHRATNADITIACLPVDKERASDFG